MAALRARRDERDERASDVAPGRVDEQTLDQRADTRNTVSAALVVAVVPIAAIIASMRKEPEDPEHDHGDNQEVGHIRPLIKINI
jgi:hypothetical protein